jgi:hypothetical protein
MGFASLEAAHGSINPLRVVSSITPPVSASSS